MNITSEWLFAVSKMTDHYTTAVMQHRDKHVSATRKDKPSEQDKRSIVAMRHDGMTFNAIARATGFSSNTCSHVFRRWREGKGVAVGRVW